MDRQTIIETNRSLRTIKNELEGLMEKGVIDDAGYENIISLLPEETRLHGGAGAGANARSTNSTPVAEQAPQQPPPAYNQTGPPSLPQRSQPPQPPAPSKPVLVHARGLYRYQGPDARDLHLDRDDQIAVHQYMNADWWMGTNLRTGQEGIFPRNYVHVEEKRGFPGQQPGYAPAPNQMPMHQGPMAPVNPYNSHVPPMAIAEGSGGQEQQQQQQQQEGGGSKMEEHGKKFGKKLGNAAIFGAGATIGGNIVNSIF